MSKQYGLILPGQQKKSQSTVPPSKEVRKPSIFDESSDSDEGPQMKMKAGPLAMAPGAMEQRMARRMQEKALEEDPTVFQYDELYDEMETKRVEEQQVKSSEPKKPKYIGRLMEFAVRRKLENELRIERQVQKDREAEGEQFKDKESFVTAAYRTKLEEMRKMEEQEKRDEYLEAIGDVTKQKDLDGFYRHLYEQKTGTSKEVQKPALLENVATHEEIAYRPIKSGKPQQRTYRKRHASIEEDETIEQAAAEPKKAHLQNNIDADSDFSIDDSSSDEDEDANGEDLKEIKENMKDNEKSVATLTDPTKITLKLELIKEEGECVEKDPSKEVKKTIGVTAADKDDTSAQISPKLERTKRDKSVIWTKRTVGAVFDAALQRYFERKASRSA